MRKLVTILWNCFVIPVGLTLSLIYKLFELILSGLNAILEFLLKVDTDIEIWNGNHQIKVQKAITDSLKRRS